MPSTGLVAAISMRDLPTDVIPHRSVSREVPLLRASHPFTDTIRSPRYQFATAKRRSARDQPRESDLRSLELEITAKNPLEISYEATQSNHRLKSLQHAAVPN